MGSTTAIQCAEVWGGVRNIDTDVRSTGIAASLFCAACDGGRGGDVYYLSVCDKDQFTRVALADVTGHGNAVAELGQWLCDSLRERLNDLNGAAVLSDLNHLATDHGFNAITTAAIIGYYIADSTLYYSYAGHYPVMLCRSGESYWSPVRDGQPDSKFENLPLGVSPDAQYVQSHGRVGRGDRIFMYTDGLIEAPGKDDSLFGEDRLKKVLHGAGDTDLVGIKQRVLQALRDHTGGVLNHDDITLIAMEIL